MDFLKFRYLILGVFIIWVFQMIYIRVNPSYTYDFIVVNDQLFAIQNNGGGYGSEKAVYTTSGQGVHWIKFGAPNRTRSLTGDGTRLFASTTFGEIWVKEDQTKAWSMIKSSSGGREYIYQIFLDANQNIVAVNHDGLTVYDTSGKLLHQLKSGKGFYQVFPYGEQNEFLIAQSSHNNTCVLDLSNYELKLWNQGIATPPYPERQSPCHIRQHGSQFLASAHDGIYVSDGLLQPWELISDKIRSDRYREMCHDLISHNAEQDEWLLVKNSGIHLVKGSVEQKHVLVDLPKDFRDESVADQPYLIRKVIPFKDYYFVDILRLKNNCIGGRLSKDLSSWEPMYLSE